MIPIELKLKGIYSYKEEQTIDFTDLSSEHLFGIFGTVGSGKSSIIEAITFALYGKIERLNDKEIKNNLINLDSNEMYIDFTFKANDGKIYNTFCKYKKRYTKKNELEITPTTNAYLIEESNKIPITFEEIEAKIGLSYQNFKRSIIIQQGSFQEFLSLSINDRAKMLEEIFDLQKYDLSYKTNIIYSKIEIEKNKIEGNLISYQDIENTTSKDFEDKIEIIDEEIKKLSAENSMLNIENEELEILKQNTFDEKIIEKKLEKLDESKEYITELKKLQNIYILFSEKFKPLLNEINKAKIEIENINNKLRNNNKEKIKIELSIEKTEIELSHILKDYENRNVLLQKADEILKINEILKNKKTLLQIENSLYAQNENKKVIEKNEAEIEQEIENKIEELKKLKTLNFDIAELSKIENWHNLKEKLLDEGKKQREKIDKQNLILDKYKNEFNVLLQNLNLKTDNNDIKEIEKEIDINIKTLNEQITILDSDQKELIIQQQLSIYSKALHQGKPCPLCGSLEHPNIIDLKDVAVNIIENEKKLDRDKKNIENWQKNKLNIFFSFNNILQIEKLKIELNDEISNQILEFKKHEKQFLWNQKYKEFSVLKSDIEISKKTENDIKAIEKNIETLRADSVQKLKNKEKLNEDIINNNLLITGLITKIDENEKNLLHLETNNFINFTDIEFIEESNKLKKDFNEISKKYELLISEKNLLTSKNIETNINIKNFNEQLRESESKLNKNENDLIFVKQNNLEITDNFIEKYLSQEYDYKRNEEEIKFYDKDLNTLSTMLKTVKEKINNREYDEERHSNIKTLNIELKEKIDIKNQEKGEFKNKLEKFKTDFENFTKLKKELDFITNKFNDLTIIKNLLSGKKFINFISTFFLEGLCIEANNRFKKLTNGQLELTLNKNNGFDIIDNFNEGRMRNAKTLSGGEKFQASLCLALSLSDIINRRSNINQNFFFMDEGFGSLDKNTLNKVFITLQTLKKENRIVGLISHVEEMQNEIDKYLVIENDKNKGSLIKYSWK